jgi:hypothetical protein
MSHKVNSGSHGDCKVILVSGDTAGLINDSEGDVCRKNANKLRKDDSIYVQCQ